MSETCSCSIPMSPTVSNKQIGVLPIKMSRSSTENKIQGLLLRLRSENNSRDRDTLPNEMDAPTVPPTRHKLPLNRKFGANLASIIIDYNSCNRPYLTIENILAFPTIYHSLPLIFSVK